MTKSAKNSEILGQLYKLVTKQAGAPKPVATGVPGKEPDSASVSAKHETVDQNAVKPETLAPQHHEQKPSTDPAKPTGGKKAEDETSLAEVPPAVSVEKLGSEIMALVQKFANNPVATGIPSHDPKWQAVSAKHETVDQNAVKPENNPQGYHQKPAKDPATPVGTAKAAEDTVDADKVASYELGKLWAEQLLKKAKDDNLAQIKEAGRRDFEALIATATSQMKQAGLARQEKYKVAAYNEKQASDVAEKQAEAQGAAAFQALYKQAQVEQAIAQIVEENRALTAKLAAADHAKVGSENALKVELAAKEAQLAAIVAEEREQQKFAAWTAHLEQRLVSRLQGEAAGSR